MNPEIADFDAFTAQATLVCDLYRDAAVLLDTGVRVVSVDEKTGMQALERARQGRPMRAGGVEKQEYEYVRHGTTCLIANLEVATGRIIAPSIGPTRDEDDFVEHIRQTLDTDPDAQWIFVADNLNTHVSAGLVRLVAERIGDDSPLGIKQQRGTLATMASRQKYLSDPTHAIRFVYTPRHCSWLNQIECWFGILARRLLRRSSFTSISHLTTRVLEFIEYFNRTLAKPFRWLFRGALRRSKVPIDTSAQHH